MQRLKLFSCLRADLAILAGVVGVAAVTIGCSGTAGGDTGDPHSKPKADEYGDGDLITDHVFAAPWFDPSNVNAKNCAFPATVPRVSFSGQVVVAVDRYDETGAGQQGTIYLEDIPQNGAAPAPYSGLDVFGASFTPPDLRVFAGDVVDTVGSFEEFPGPSTSPFQECRSIPEVSGTISLRFQGGTVPPVLIGDGAADATFPMIKGYANARQWLGMLVTLKNVQIAAAPYCKGCTSNDCTKCEPDEVAQETVQLNTGGGIEQLDEVFLDNELFDLRNDGPILTSGTTIKSITGVWTFFYGFHIAPRSVDDIQL